MERSLKTNNKSAKKWEGRTFLKYKSEGGVGLKKYGDGIKKDNNIKLRLNNNRNRKG